MDSKLKYDALCDDIKELIQITEEDFLVLNKHKEFFVQHSKVLLDFI